MPRRTTSPQLPQRPAQETSENSRGLSPLVVLGGSLLFSLAAVLVGCGHPTIVFDLGDPDASISEDAGADADADAVAEEDGGE